MQKNKTVLSRQTLDKLSESEKLKIKGKYKEALKIAENILIDNPGCTEAVEEIADNYFSLGQYEKAKKAANYALILNKKSYLAHYVLGFSASRENRWTEAINHLRVSNEEHPNNAEILRCLGWALYHNRKKKDGIFTIQRALSLSPDDTDILCDLGACYIEEENFTKAKKYFGKAVSINPHDQRAQDFLILSKRLINLLTQKQ